MFDRPKGESMPGALIFNGANALDFQEIRANVIRIPEVIHSVREAQGIWDALNPSPFDLTNFIGSDDHDFLSQIKLKNFATAVIQVGLLRRYMRHHPLPEFLIGTVNGDSPLRVALRQISFVEMVAESEAIPRERLTLVSKDAPLLAGVRLAEYAVFQSLEDGGYKRLEYETRDVRKMAENLISENRLDHLVFVGPGVWNQPLSGSVTVSESIELDANLSWFWAQAKENNRFAVAN